MTTNLLVVDWDYFFPTQEVPTDDDHETWQLFDWGHSETSPLFFEAIWPSRAAAFLRNDRELPNLSGEEANFWRRFNIKPRATLFYADSNSQAAHPRVSRNVDASSQVWLFDAHHDSGYNNTLQEILYQGKVSCEDWMVLYSVIGADLHMRYPTWRSWAKTYEPEPVIEVDREFDDGQPIDDVTFDRVFVCRSSAWTPPWLDDAFERFIASAPTSRKVKLDNIQKRDWDPGLVEAMNETWKSMGVSH